MAESETTPQTHPGAVVAAEQEPDGIYLVFNDGRHVLFTGDNADDDCAGCIGIGVKWGSKSIVVALCDQADGEEITLTIKKCDGKYAGYIESYLDAVADWNGRANTEHLKKIGLNPAIQLRDGEYIPALPKLYLIFLNRKAINAAMRFVGGQELAGWYWSSTEYNAPYAWYLGLNHGTAYYTTKAADSRRLRPVSALFG